MGTGGVAKTEALALFALTKNGDSIDDVRKLIGNGSGYRRQVRLHFDALVARKPLPKGTKQRVRCVVERVSPELKNEVKAQLRAGRSHAAIRETVPVGPGLILNVSKEIHASELKKGRGRRLPLELQEQIRAAIREGQRPTDIVHRLGVCEKTVGTFRRELGDFENRRYRRKLTPAQIEEATVQLRHGDKWRDVAEYFGVSTTTLGHAVPYRKREGRNYYELDAKQTLALRNALKEAHGEIVLKFSVDYPWLRRFLARDLRDVEAL